MPHYATIKKESKTKEQEQKVKRNSTLFNNINMYTTLYTILTTTKQEENNNKQTNKQTNNNNKIQ